MKNQTPYLDMLLSPTALGIGLGLILLLILVRRIRKRRAAPAEENAGEGKDTSPAQTVAPGELRRIRPARPMEVGSLRFEDIVKSSELKTVTKVEEEFIGELKGARLADDKREKLLVSSLVRWRVYCLFERVYQSCLHSQFDLLEIMNGNPAGVGMEQARRLFMERKAKENRLTGMEFEDWIGYLVGSGLASEQYDHYAITELGKDYLIYLASTGSRKALWTY